MRYANSMNEHICQIYIRRLPFVPFRGTILSFFFGQNQRGCESPQIRIVWHKKLDAENSNRTIFLFLCKISATRTYRIKEIIMRSRTTSWVHIMSLGYGETMATQTAKKNRECSSVRTSNYCRFAFVALLNEEFLRGSTNCRSREFFMSYCLIESSFPIVQFDKDSLTSFEWRQHKTSGNPIESSGKKNFAHLARPRSWKLTFTSFIP